MVAFELILCFLQFFTSCYSHNYEVHCNPYSNQICPNGQLCDRKILDCLRTDDGETYCLCPAYNLDYRHDTHHHHDSSHHYEHSHLDYRHDNRHHHESSYHYESSHHDVHCNPYSNQICPNGEFCNHHSLECINDDFDKIDYCICPTSIVDIFPIPSHPAVPPPPVFEVHCNPESLLQQLCPNGHLCDSNLLDCQIDNYHNRLYCICPNDHSDDVHCNPNSHLTQVCPGGQLCSPHLLQCTRKKNNPFEWDYCECPKYYYHHHY